MNSAIKVQFKQAINSKDLPQILTLLHAHPYLVNTDLRPTENQDQLSTGFPLHLAAKTTQYDICKILLEHGADPNAVKDDDERPDFGTPICFAVEHKDYRLANLLLDYKADPNAYGYCDTPMIQALYHQARADGMDQSVLRYAYSDYLNEKVALPVLNEPTSSITTFYRVLETKATPNVSAVLRDEYYELLADLLERCPMATAPKTSYPKGTIFEVVAYTSSWYGYPRAMNLCMDTGPDLFTTAVAKQCIHRGVISHNRDGNIEDYSGMIRALLQFLDSKGALDDLRSSPDWNPFYQLAEHFCWPSNYGFKAAVSTPEDIIQMTELFLDYGFENHHQAHPINGDTPIEKATLRIDHRGMVEYVDFLKSLK